MEESGGGGPRRRRRLFRAQGEFEKEEMWFSGALGEMGNWEVRVRVWENGARVCMYGFDGVRKKGSQVWEKDS